MKNYVEIMKGIAGRYEIKKFETERSNEPAGYVWLWFDYEDYLVYELPRFYEIAIHPSLVNKKAMQCCCDAWNGVLQNSLII